MAVPVYLDFGDGKLILLGFQEEKTGAFSPETFSAGF
jgi:hypothetical protein